MKKIIRIIATALCLAICVCGLSAATAAKETKTASTTQIITRAEAKKIALDYVGGGKVREAELDYEKGVLIYEIEIKYDGYKYEVDVDAQTGEIVRYKSNNPKDTVAEKSELITRDEAKKAALDYVGGGRVKDIELEKEKGVWVYEIEVRYNGWEYDVDIDAATGDVLKCRIDD